MLSVGYTLNDGLDENWIEPSLMRKDLSDNCVFTYNEDSD